MEVSEAEHKPLVGLPVVEVIRQVGKPFLFGVPLPSTSSFSLSLSINLFANNLNVSGLDWVGGLKKLTLPLELLSPISVACIEEPPSVSVLEPFLLEQFPPCFPPESTDSGYFLCSCTKGPYEGLGKAIVGTPRGSGRISHFEKAQTRARTDLLEGK